MFEDIELGGEFFRSLTAIDTAITARVAAAGCRFCSGRLYRGDYQRKPRGGLLAASAEAFRRRFSLCCGHGSLHRVGQIEVLDLDHAKRGTPRIALRVKDLSQVAVESIPLGEQLIEWLARGCCAGWSATARSSRTGSSPRQESP